MDSRVHNLTLSHISHTPGYLDNYNQSTIANSTTNSETTCSQPSKVLYNAGIGVSCIIFILGIIGNGLVIWIAGFRMKKTISAVWFLHLAIADFLCCLSLPLYIADLAADSFFKKSKLLEVNSLIAIFLLTVNTSASVLLLTAMSIDRWVSVMWPFWAKVHRTRKLVRITAGIIWGLSLIGTGIVIYIWNSDDIFMFSILCLDSYERLLPLNLTILVTLFVIPFLIIITSYVTILLKLRKSNRPQRSQRPYRIIIAIILCFFICCSPFYICPLIPYDIVQKKIVDVIVTIMVCLNSCMNPIIYVFMGENFKHGFLRSIPVRLKSALSEHPDGPYKEQLDPQPSPTTNV